MKSLILIPNLIANDCDCKDWIPNGAIDAIQHADGIIAESNRGIFSFFKKFKTKNPPNKMPFAILNKNTKNEDLDFLLEPIMRGESWGLISDAGLPCIADPGASLVARARNLEIPIKSFGGVSSITLAIMLSGLNFQKFSFLGYLPKQYSEIIKNLKNLERKSKNDNEGIIFIEAPHKNVNTMKAITEALNPTSIISLCINLTSPQEFVKTLSVAQWKSTELPDNLHKNPCIFILYAR